jgi:hypothetical protein
LAAFFGLARLAAFFFFAIAIVSLLSRRFRWPVGIEVLRIAKNEKAPGQARVFALSCAAMNPRRAWILSTGQFGLRPVTRFTRSIFRVAAAVSRQAA